MAPGATPHANCDVAARAADDPVAVDDVIDTIGFGRFHVRLMLLVGLVFSAEALEIFLLTFIRDSVQRDLGGTSATLALLPTAVFFGMLVGSLVWGTASDAHGRRAALVGILVVQIIGGVLSSLAPSLLALILLRFIVGVGVGGGHIAPSLFMELLPRRGREKWVIVTYSFWSIGVLVLCFVAYLMRHCGWRALTLVCVTPYAVCVCMLPFVVESPKQLLLKGRADEALDVLRTIARVCGADVPDAPLQSVPAAESAGHTGLSYLKHIASVVWAPDVRRMTFVLWLIWMGVALSYYGVIMLTTASMLGSDDGASDAAKYGAVALSAAGELPAYVAMWYCARSYGRKVPLVVAPVISANVLLVSLLCHMHRAWLPGAAAIQVVCAFSVRAAMIFQFDLVYLYSPEAYPTEVRTAGTGACSAAARLATMVAPAVAYPLQEVSPVAPYIVFAGVLLCSAVAASQLPFDTRNRVLHDVGLGGADETTGTSEDATCAAA